jgi:DNA-binding response OmpR family regulator
MQLFEVEEHEPPIKVPFVEDDERFGKLLVRYREENQLRVTWVVNGAEGDAAATTQGFDVLEFKRVPRHHP